MAIPQLLLAGLAIGGVLLLFGPRKKSAPNNQVRGTLGNMSLKEAEAFFEGLVAVDLVQLRDGVPGISDALYSKQIRYLRRDPQEQWLTLREVWENGGGDCEDLAAALAAERIHAGLGPHKVQVIENAPGDGHAVTYDIHRRRIHDPSLTGGMGAPDEGPINPQRRRTRATRSSWGM